MAKQFGIHQLRGKVGDMAYYRQSGVAAGLVRSINQSLSDRVKNDVAYANTRLNNQEFKTATRFAGSMLAGVVPSYRPMFENFKNAHVSQKILEIIKTATGQWGQRMIGQTNLITAASAISSLAKIDFTKYGVFSASNESDDLGCRVTLSESCADVLASIGADGLFVKFLNVYVYEGRPTADPAATPVNVTVIADTATSEPATIAEGSQVNETLTDPGADLSLVNGRVLLKFAYCIIMPYRTVSSTKHVLQEACTFAALSSPLNEA